MTFRNFSPGGRKLPGEFFTKEGREDFLGPLVAEPYTLRCAHYSSRATQ
jgi:hypothetical protein